MKPDIKVLLDQAKQPRSHYVPARAGWNGPEEKSADARNATYEQLRREPSPVEMKQQLLAAVIPDWRILLTLGTIILILRSTVRRRRGALAAVLEFPKPSMGPVTDAVEAA